MPPRDGSVTGKPLTYLAHEREPTPPGRERETALSSEFWADEQQRLAIGDERAGMEHDTRRPLE
jgi:hypothetical protein